MSLLYKLYQAAWRPLFAPITSGTNIFSRDWDLLVILDACRVDSLIEVETDIDSTLEIDSIRSVGSQSKEWLAKTFTSEYRPEISETTVLTANIFTDEVFGESSNDRRTNPANWETVEREEIGDLVELWRTEWEDDIDTVPPELVTDAAITTARQTDPERLIVHYMQPHEPFIAGEEPIHDVWEQIRTGDLSVEDARIQYLENLRLVLSQVERLLENVDAPRTVLTADHGNAFGEWGIYGHPIGFQHPVVKNVPWATTSARDEETSVPNWTPTTTGVSSDVDERLAALGYR